MTFKKLFVFGVAVWKVQPTLTQHATEKIENDGNYHRREIIPISVVETSALVGVDVISVVHLVFQKSSVSERVIEVQDADQNRRSEYFLSRYLQESESLIGMFLFAAKGDKVPTSGTGRSSRVHRHLLVQGRRKVLQPVPDANFSEGVGRRAGP